METNLKNHPAADLFPMMSDERYAELRDGLRDNGFYETESIKLYEGKILDGRNRYKACVELEIEARFEHIDGNPFAIAWALNGKRRDLATVQRAVIYQLITQASDEWDEFNDKVAAAANKKRSESQIGIPKAEKERAVTTCDGTLRDHAAEAAGRSSTAKAKAAGTNRGAVDQAAKLIRERPDLAHLVAMGDLKATQAHRIVKRDKIANRVEPFPDGKFRVIYADPAVAVQRHA